MSTTLQDKPGQTKRVPVENQVGGSFAFFGGENEKYLEDSPKAANLQPPHEADEPRTADIPEYVQNEFPRGSFSEGSVFFTVNEGPVDRAAFQESVPLETTAPVTEARDIDVPTANHNGFDLFEKFGKAGSVAGNMAENAAKILPGAVKEVGGALKGLVTEGFLLGVSQPTQKKEQPQASAETKKDHLTHEQRAKLDIIDAWLKDLDQKIGGVSLEKRLEDINRLGGDEVAAMGKEERNKRRGVQANYQGEESVHDIVEIRASLTEDQVAFEEMEDSRAAQEVIVIAGAPEGGTAGGKQSASTINAG